MAASVLGGEDPLGEVSTRAKAQMQECVWGLLENSKVTVASVSGLWSPNIFWPQTSLSIPWYGDGNNNNAILMLAVI